jgi:hypothetical protein
MEKLVYVLWPTDGSDSTQFNNALLTQVPTALHGSSASRIAVNIVDADSVTAGGSVLTRFDTAPSAVISFWLPNSDDREACEKTFSSLCDKLAGYLVVESVPLVNTTHTAAAGQRTPGINVLALIECPDSMTHADWIAHWKGHHKRVALRTQSTYEYIRNEVVRALTDDAPAFAAIVEEGFPTEALSDPMVWYAADGSQEKLEANFTAMMESVNAFLEIPRVESHPMSQYVLED